MTEPTTTKASQGLKTLGVRLSDGLHAQFALVASLNNLSLNDAVLAAVQAYVDANRAEAGFGERAAAALAAIEAEAEARRGAIQSLFSAQDPTATETGGSPRRKRGEQTS